MSFDLLAIILSIHLSMHLVHTFAKSMVLDECSVYFPPGSRLSFTKLLSSSAC